MAGSAETTITPTPVETFLIGPMKESTGVNDDLFARALVISDGEKRIAIVTMDFLGLDFSFNEIPHTGIRRCRRTLHHRPANGWSSTAPNVDQTLKKSVRKCGVVSAAESPSAQ